MVRWEYQFSFGLILAIGVSVQVLMVLMSCDIQDDLVAPSGFKLYHSTPTLPATCTQSIPAFPAPCLMEQVRTSRLATALVKKCRGNFKILPR